MTDMTPRRWWAGPLDVERLAWSAVVAARDAARRVVHVRGQSGQVETSAELVAASFAAPEHLRLDGRALVEWAPMSGFFPARDGWVRLHANYPHHAAAIERALCVDGRPALERVVATLPAAEVEHVVTAHHGVAVEVRTAPQWWAHAHGRRTAADPWATTDLTGDRPVLTGGTLPLDGVRVLDLTRVVAGPTCSQLLACLGADVMRVDPPHRPEILGQYLSNGMGKRSASVDLRERAEDVHAMLGEADVILLGHRPGALDRFGLAPRAIVQRHPRVVVASLSAWGEHGPWAHRRGFDSIVQAATGIAMTCADADGRPGALPVQALDHATGHLLAAHVMTMLADARSGVIRASLLGAARTLLVDSPPPPGEAPPLCVPLVTLATPGGRVAAVPPALTLDGATLERPIGAYGAADLAWAAA